jgi:hypothetical protein
MAFLPSEDSKDYATWRQERKSKGSFGINVSAGEAVGFSGIPGKGTYNFRLGDRKIKSKQFTKEPSGRSSEDTVRGDQPKRPTRTAIARPIYDGEVVEPRALPDGKKGIENNIIDAEIVETPKAIGGSRRAIEAPPQRAIEAPKTRAASPIVNNPNKGKQFISVDKQGGATPLVKTSQGPAVDFTR